MRSLSFNEGWQFRRIALDGEEDAPFKEVTLPHDAMIGETRSPQAVSAFRTAAVLRGVTTSTSRPGPRPRSLLASPSSSSSRGSTTLPRCGLTASLLPSGRTATRTSTLTSLDSWSLAGPASCALLQRTPTSPTVAGTPGPESIVPSRCGLGSRFNCCQTALPCGRSRWTAAAPASRSRSRRAVPGAGNGRTASPRVPREPAATGRMGWAQTAPGRRCSRCRSPPWSPDHRTSTFAALTLRQGAMPSTTARRSLAFAPSSGAMTGFFSTATASCFAAPASTTTTACWVPVPLLTRVAQGPAHARAGLQQRRSRSAHNPARRHCSTPATTWAC